MCGYVCDILCKMFVMKWVLPGCETTCGDAGGAGEGESSLEGHAHQESQERW